MIYALTRDPLDIVLGDPAIPVLLQLARRHAPVLVLAERVLVNDGIVAGTVEQRRGDPGFKHKPLFISQTRKLNK